MRQYFTSFEVTYSYIPIQQDTINATKRVASVAVDPKAYPCKNGAISTVRCSTICDPPFIFNGCVYGATEMSKAFSRSADRLALL